MAAEKRAFITGITGQDGGHLTELLHQKGYEIYGLLRGQRNTRREALLGEFPYVRLIEADLTDQSSLVRAIETSQPDEIYNLAAISHVGFSFRNPDLTADVTAKGVLGLLEAVRINGMADTARFYQASTSEMFGGLDYNRPGSGYNEDSAFHPRSPYGVAKLYAHWIARNYRESYGMYVSCGILFNHEGERRGLEFVTRKITNAVARIHLGKQEYVTLGDLWPKRDWGYAGDYVRGMWMMLQQDEADDYVLATGQTKSIEDFLTAAFAEIGVSDWTPFVRQDQEFMRPIDVDILLGDATKARTRLGWTPEVDFAGLVGLMVQNDIKLESQQ